MVQTLAGREKLKSLDSVYIFSIGVDDKVGVWCGKPVNVDGLKVVATDVAHNAEEMNNVKHWGGFEDGPAISGRESLISTFDWKSFEIFWVESQRVES